MAVRFGSKQKWLMQELYELSSAGRSFDLISTDIPSGEYAAHIRTLDGFVANGFAVKNGYGCYSITDAGKEAYTSQANFGSTAEISACGKYRYSLHRRWDANKQRRVCVFIMLNPSTASATKDDQTIRRCVGFAKALSCTELAVVNLFAHRAADPDELLKMDVPTAVGPDNDMFIAETLKDEGVSVVVGAWGAHRAAELAYHELSRCVEVALMVRDAGKIIYCLGETRSGSPKHPLYAPKGSPLIRWVF